MVYFQQPELSLPSPLLAAEIRCLSKCSLLTLIRVCFDRSMSSSWWWRCTRWWSIPPPWNPTLPGWGVSGEGCHSRRWGGRPVVAWFETACVRLTHACVKEDNKMHHYCRSPPPKKFHMLPLTWTFIWFFSSLKLNQTNNFSFQVLFWSIGGSFSVILWFQCMWGYIAFFLLFLHNCISDLCYLFAPVLKMDATTLVVLTMAKTDPPPPFRFPSSIGLHLLDKKTNPWPFLCLDSCSTVCLG